MKVGIMVTNGGPHRADKLAASTAWKIADLIRISEEPINAALPELDRLAVEGNREAFRQARTKLEEGVASLLEKHHDEVQRHERGKLKERGSARLADDHDHEACGETLSAEIVALTKGTALEAHFAQPATVARVAEILDQAFGLTAHIERAWHADRNPDDGHCRAFKARHQVETPAASPA